jgi:hypothetical protein
LNPASILSKKSMLGIIIAIALVGIMTIIIFVIPPTNTTPPNTVTSSFAKLVSNSNTGEDKSIVPLDQIVSGGPPPDGIPSIDNPKFVSVQEADKFLQGSDLVLGLNINGDIRAYPLQILVWHEIVNDKVGRVPVAITYCPLCFTNQVFNSTLRDKTVVKFGTSGKLYNSNLVMYDRTSKSLWSQALAEGIVGKYAGMRLDRIPFDVANWKDWNHLYPNSKVLSKDTGFSRPYGADPYDGYYTSNEVLFPVSNRDDRLGLKEIVVGLENGSQYQAYKLQQIESGKVINVEFNGKSIALISLHPSMVRAYDRVVDAKKLDFEYISSRNKILDKQTGSEWNFEGLAINGQMKGKHLTRLPFDEGFWFEWVAFHPNTGLYSR